MDCCLPQCGWEDLGSVEIYDAERAGDAELADHVQRYQQWCKRCAICCILMIIHIVMLY